MPTPEHLDQLTTAFEQYQAGLEARIARTPTDDPGAEEMRKLNAILTETFGKFMSGVKEHNQKVESVVKETQTLLKNAEAQQVQKQNNRPRPRPRLRKAKVVADPYLEEKLQLALHTPFGNRTPHTK